MAIPTLRSSPQGYARIAGILYLWIIVAGSVGQFLLGDRLIVSGDAAATAQHIMVSRSLWRMGVANEILMHVFDIPIMVIVYGLLKPVHKSLALLAVLLNLVQTAVLVANSLNIGMPLLLLGNAKFLDVFEPGQLYALAYLFLRAHDYGTLIGLLFFGFTCLVNGYLLFHSGYFPRAVGVLLTLAGVGYLANSFLSILAPDVTVRVVPVLLFAFVGELSFCLWLLFKGVDLHEWQKRVAESE